MHFPFFVVMQVSFDQTFRRVREGQGVLEVNLVKSEGAVGPVRVRLFTEDFTARGQSVSHDISKHTLHYIIFLMQSLDSVF